jgi:hypothetical protein
VTIESRKMLEHAVHAAIRSGNFYGYIEFNNKYRSIQSTETAVRDQLIRETFSDRVIIVDEAHHLRSSRHHHRSERRSEHYCQEHFERKDSVDSHAYVRQSV